MAILVRQTANVLARRQLGGKGSKEMFQCMTSQGLALLQPFLRSCHERMFPKGMANLWVQNSQPLGPKQPTFGSKTANLWVQNSQPLGPVASMQTVGWAESNDSNIRRVHWARKKCPEIDCPKNPDLNVMVGGGDGFLGREILLA